MIDDLEELSHFRAEVPQTSEASRARARADLELAIQDSTNRCEPAGGINPARSKVARFAIVAAAASFCALILLLGVSASGSRPSTAAAATFNRLANIAAHGPSLVPGVGQFLYVSSEGRGTSYIGAPPKQCVVSEAGRTQMWTAADGSGMQQSSTSRLRYTSTADRVLCNGMHVHQSRQGRGRLWFAAGCGALGPAPDMLRLSTNPQTLLTEMRRIDGGPETPAEDFVHVGDFLRDTDASPELRAALYRAAALIRGISVLGTVRDHIGRTGLGVAIEDKGVQHELIFNAQTSALMGEASQGSAPNSDNWAVYFESRVVSRLPKTSPVALSPGCVHGGGTVHRVPGGSVITG